VKGYSTGYITPLQAVLIEQSGRRPSDGPVVITRELLEKSRSSIIKNNYNSLRALESVRSLSVTTMLGIDRYAH
jgi:hypothetical protein